MKTGLIHLAGWVILGVAGIVALPAAKTAVESRLTAEAMSRLQSAGLSDVTVTASGQDLTLSGPAEAVASARTLLKAGLTGGLFTGLADGFWSGPVTAIQVPAAAQASQDSAVTASSEESQTSMPPSSVGPVSVSSSSVPVSAAASVAATPAPAITAPLTKAGQRCQDRIDAVLKRSRISFAFNAYELTPQGRRTVRDIHRVLSRCSAPVRLTITGHTDTIGSEAVNQSLSAGRAVAAMNALTALGYPDARVEALGLGSAEPVASNANLAGRKQNRRVVFTLHPVS